MKKKKQNPYTELIIFVSIVIALTFFLHFYVLQKAGVKGLSMSPTLDDGDTLLMEKLSYRFHEPRIGNIVVVPYEDRFLIKRVIGVPGDTLEIKKGELYRNGEKIKEDYIKEPMNKDDEMDPTAIEKGKVFLMGDNRNNSSDSRVYGQFDINKIKGRVFLELSNNFFKTY